MKKILRKIFVNDVSWLILSPFIWAAQRLIASRKNYKSWPAEKKLKSRAEKVLNSNFVYSGPFMGMIYKTSLTTGASSYYAKLLGSYETEIHVFIEDVLKKSYDGIINIGCDDGYYAVGMAVKTGCPVTAYDINPGAIIKTKQLALANNTSHLLKYGNRFTAADIGREDAVKKNLYIVDCEGDEYNIFTETNAALLINSDIIVELHLSLHPQIEQHFRNLFENTHSITVVNSTPDFIKAASYTHLQLSGLDFETRHFITEERDVFMQWIYLDAKSW